MSAYNRLITVAISFLTCLNGVNAQVASDSLIEMQLKEKGISFSDNNSITLLMNGQEKFDDMFCAIRHKAVCILNISTSGTAQWLRSFLTFSPKR